MRMTATGIFKDTIMIKHRPYDRAVKETVIYWLVSERFVRSTRYE